MLTCEVTTDIANEGGHLVLLCQRLSGPSPARGAGAAPLRQRREAGWRWGWGLGFAVLILFCDWPEAFLWVFCGPLRSQLHWG